MLTLDYFLSSCIVNFSLFRNYCQSISLETSIRLTWYDTRIEINSTQSAGCTEQEGKCYILVNRNATSSIWLPDVYVDKTKDLRNPVYQIPPASMQFYDNHKLFYNQRINYDLSCPMQFNDYPVSSHILIANW